MAATIMRKAYMEELINRLKADYPDFSFVEGSLLCWSPAQKQIFYNPNGGAHGIWGVLHEIGHARLGHSSYTSDIELVRKEILAWQEARLLAGHYDFSLDNDHIQDCLDTYRDWLHKRSVCPECAAKGLQTARERYKCINCNNEWRVSSSRFCRPYRLQQQKPGAKNSGFLPETTN